MNEKDEYFFCYSGNVLRFLKNRGQRYICTGLHPVSKSQFFLFKQTAELSAALNEFKLNRGQKQNGDGLL